MQRVVALCVVAGLSAGCAVNKTPSLSFGGSDGSEDAQAVETQQASESSMFSNLWDNFSAPFRGDAKPKPAATAPRPVALPKPPALNEKEALKLVNAFRKQKGLRPLTLEPRLAKAASLLSTDMSKYDRMSHYGPDGGDIEYRLETAGYNYSVAAENIGAGQITIEEMVDGWKKSPSHAKNMLLADGRHMGIAMSYRPETRFKTFWTLVIGAPQ